MPVLNLYLAQVAAETGTVEKVKQQCHLINRPNFSEDHCDRLGAKEHDFYEGEGIEIHFLSQYSDMCL